MISSFTIAPRSLGRLIVRNRATTTQHFSAKYAPPIEPINFNKDFAILPYDFVLPLEEINKHPFDESMRFDPVKHEYYYDDKKMKYSVTGLVSKFFAKFDSDEAIKKMMSGSKWPRPEYMKGDRAMTAEEIKAKWYVVGEYSRNRGTWMHHNIERYFNGLPTSNKLEEMLMVETFKNEFLDRLNIVPFRTEWCIAAPDLGLAGCVDFVGRNPDGSYNIYDWKRAKQILFTNKYANAKAPIEHVPDCDGIKYSLQLNLYRHILQKYYDIEIRSMTLISFYDYKKFDIPIMEKETQAIISTLKRS